MAYKMKWPLLILLTFAMLKGFSQGDSQRMETKHPYAPMNPSGSRYYPELHYTDENGNNQIHTNDRKGWIPISKTSTTKVVVKDQYGKEWKVLYFSLNTPCIFIGTHFGNNLIPITESDTLLPWQIEMLNRFKENCPGYISATIEDENGNKKQVVPLKIDGGCR